MQNSQIVFLFVNFSGQITAEQSLFTYGPGESVDTFKNVSFKPLFLDSIFINESIRIACGNDFSCIYDAIATGDISVGLASKQTSENLQNDSKILGKSCGNCSSIVLIVLINSQIVLLK